LAFCNRFGLSCLTVGPPGERRQRRKIKLPEEQQRRKSMVASQSLSGRKMAPLADYFRSNKGAGNRAGTPTQTTGPAGLDASPSQPQSLDNDKRNPSEMDDMVRVDTNDTLDLVTRHSRVPGNTTYYEKGGLRTMGDGEDHVHEEPVSTASSSYLGSKPALLTRLR
jgi:hypothetical protein